LHNKNNPEKGFQAECKICATLKSGKRQSNKRIETNKYKSDWYFKNKEKILEIRKEYRVDHLEELKAMQSEWRKNNPERTRYHASKHKNHDVSTKEYNDMLKVFNYKCAYCGMTLEEHKKKYHERLHNDHVDDDGYNDLRNDVPACKSCNCGKHERNMEEWYRKQTFFSEEKLDKIKWWITEGYKNYIEEKPPYRISMRRVYNKDGSYYMIHELWSVDEKRNMLELIGEGNKKKDLKPYIEEYLDFLENYCNEVSCK
jgi:hypothetical protein